MGNLPEHSPLGASGAGRWMVCPGSVSLTRGVHDEDSEFAALGTAAHCVAARCLSQNDPRDAWELIGGRFNGQPVDRDMANAVQVYLNSVRSHFPGKGRESGVEFGFHCKTLHELFYGRVDYFLYDMPQRRLKVWDYKHGAGVMVDVPWNAQAMYYACGLLEARDLWGEVDVVELCIVQPRGFHYDGPIREWSIYTADLYDWLHDKLLPAMRKAEVSSDTKSGEHCRFCPARSRACPQLVADMKELQEMTDAIQKSKKGVADLTNAQLGRFMSLFHVAKIVHKAALGTTMGRLQGGQDVPGFKLSHARANRQWKDGAREHLLDTFGKDAWEERKLRSPAGIEALPLGKASTTRFAFKPKAGLTVTPVGDGRRAVNQTTKSMFTPVPKGSRR